MTKDTCINNDCSVSGILEELMDIALGVSRFDWLKLRG